MALHEELGDDAAQRGGEHGAHLALLVGGEDVDDTVNGFAGVVRVERAKDEEAGLRSGQSERDGFQVAHFADEHDVRILTQRGAEAIGEGRGLDGHLTLGDDALFVPVHEFDRFLDGDDVTAEVGIDVIEQGGERGGLAGAGGAGDEDEAAAHVAEFFDDRRDVELLERGDLRGNDTEDAGEAVLLLEVVAAEAVIAVHLVGEVEIAFVDVFLPGLGIADLAHHSLHHLAGEDFVGDGLDAAVNAHLRRLTLAEMQVGTADFNEGAEVVVDDGHWRAEKDEKMKTKGSKRRAGSRTQSTSS